MFAAMTEKAKGGTDRTRGEGGRLASGTPRAPQAPPTLAEMNLTKKESARQLGRRNLTPDQLSLLRGRRYNRLKGPLGGDRKSSSQKVNLIAGRVSEVLGAEHGVSHKTIVNDGHFAAAVETLKPIVPGVDP